MTKLFVVAQAAAAAATTVVLVTERNAKRRRKDRRRALPYAVAIFRKRRSVFDVFQGLGDLYFRRAYRMSYDSFLLLHEKLRDGIISSLKVLNSIKKDNRTARSDKKTGHGPRGNYLPKALLASPASNTIYKDPPITNGPIETSVRLACAIRYFAGGSVYDLMIKYGISNSAVYDSIWVTVESVNSLPEFFIQYPADHDEQRAITSEFQTASAVNFDSCAGAIDGILIWMTKPTVPNCTAAGVGQKNFLCGRKHKFGINCQAVSDRRGRFLDISMGYGGASADCIAFEASDLYRRLQNNLLAPNLVLFGDNAYVNSTFMATPFPKVGAGSRDNYNFYHSQVR